MVEATEDKEPREDQEADLMVDLREDLKVDLREDLKVDLREDPRVDLRKDLEADHRVEPRKKPKEVDKEVVSLELELERTNFF